MQRWLDRLSTRTCRSRDVSAGVYSGICVSQQQYTLVFGWVNWRLDDLVPPFAVASTFSAIACAGCDVHAVHIGICMYRQRYASPPAFISSRMPQYLFASVVACDSSRILWRHDALLPGVSVVHHVGACFYR